MWQMGNTGHYDPEGSLLFRERERELWSVALVWCQSLYKIETRGWLSIQPQGACKGIALENLCPACGLSVTSSQMLGYQGALLNIYA